MAMLDYGAVVKKNGKIISTKMFENFSSLKYEEKEIIKTDEDGIEYPNFETLVDETIVQTLDGDEKSMAGNYFALIGDKDMLIGFYKDWFTLAIDKKVIDNTDYFTWVSSEHKRDFVKEYPVLGKINIKRLDKRIDYCNVLVASFTYKSDKYEVMFGYGVDVNVNYAFSNRNYFAPRKPDRKSLKNSHHFWGGYDDWNRSKSKQHKYRRILRHMREWYKKGLEI